MTINVTRSSMPPYEEYCEEIKDLWDSHWLTNMGPKHAKLQTELEKYLDVKHVTLYTNGHLALENAISLFDFPKGSEIITTPFTFASTTHAIVRCGCVPVFCDIKQDDYTINPKLIEELITERTVAILPVHVYGNICDVNAIQKIADKHNLKVIYDAAHAFGEKYMGQSVANFGDFSMFSFHATKVYNTIEGGCLCYNSNKYEDTLYNNKNFGIRGPESVVYIGGNAKMNEFQAAMGLCNLKYVNEEISKRRKVFNHYVELLKDVDGIKIPHLKSNTKYNYAYLPVVFDGKKYKRDKVFDKLNKHDIIARKYFYPLTSDFECYQNYINQRKRESLKIAADVASNVLTLPLYSDLSNEIIKKICSIIL